MAPREFPMCTRRTLLTAALAVPVAGLAACAGKPPEPECGDLAALPTVERVGGALLVSEASGRPGPIPMAQGFADQLGAWADHWAEISPGVDQLWLWPPAPGDDGSCTWRAAGRGVELTRLRAGRELVADLRIPTAELDGDDATARWRLIAGLNRYFANVDTEADRGLAIDDQWPLEAPKKQTTGPFTTFRRNNIHQVRCAQALAAVMWQRPVSIDGSWGDETAGALKEILTELDLPTDLTRPEAWQGLLQHAEQP